MWRLCGPRIARKLSHWRTKQGTPPVRPQNLSNRPTQRRPANSARPPPILIERRGECGRFRPLLGYTVNANDPRGDCSAGEQEPDRIDRCGAAVIAGELPP